MTPNADGRTVQATKRTFDVVEYLLESDGARLTEVANALDLANSTAHNHLRTLRELGYVVRDGDEHRVSLEFLRVGGRARDQKRANKLSRQMVDKVADVTGEDAIFMVEENGRGYHVYVAPGERDTHVDTRAGKRIYLHANASGKAMLAYYDEERVDEILDRWGMPAITQNTITDRDAFKAELAETRERGYGLNREEHIPGYRGVAAPVRKHDGEVLGALCIGAPTRRLQGDRLEREVPQKLLEAVNEFELKVEFD